MLVNQKDDFFPRPPRKTTVKWKGVERGRQRGAGGWGGQGGWAMGVERIYSLLLIIFPEDLANAEPSIIVGALYGGSACDEC